MAVIADEDTITGFLLAGVGDVDLRKRSNFLIVDGKTTVRQIEASFKEFTARDDVAIVLVSQPIANMIRHVVANHSKVRDATARPTRAFGGGGVACAPPPPPPSEEAVVLLLDEGGVAVTAGWQAGRCRAGARKPALERPRRVLPASLPATQAIPAVLEIPSKDSPYDPNQDSLLQRVKHLLGLV